MDIYKLSILEFLVYIEITIIVFMILRHIFHMLIGLFTVALNLIEWKSNIVGLLTEIPAMLLIILTAGHLANINTIDKTSSMKILYFSMTALLILIYRITYQGDIYEIAHKRNDFLLHYHSRKFFRITYWFYFIFFLLLVCGIVNGDNSITALCLRIISWALNLKFIGWIIPLVAGMMVIGTFWRVFFTSLALIFGQKSRL